MVTAADGLEAQASIRAVVELWPRLKARLRPGGGDPLQGRVSGSSEPPLPIDTGVSDLLFEVEESARFYARVLCDEATITSDEWREVDGVKVRVPAVHPWEPRTSHMPGLLAEVAEHYGHFTADEDKTALDFCDWAHETLRKVRATLERPEPARWRGGCPRTIEEPITWHGEEYVAGDPCPGSLFLRPGRVSMRCPACGGDVGLDESRAHLYAELARTAKSLAGLRDSFVTLDMDIPYDTIKKWAQRGKITEVDERLYSLDDAYSLAVEYLAKKGVLVTAC